jgi:hypothetical protein
MKDPAQRGPELQLASPSYRLAALDQDFLLADAQRRELFDRRGHVGGAVDVDVVFRRRQGLGRASKSAATRHGVKENLTESARIEGEELEKLCGRS